MPTPTPPPGKTPAIKDAKPPVNPDENDQTPEEDSAIKDVKPPVNPDENDQTPEEDSAKNDSHEVKRDDRDPNFTRVTKAGTVNTEIPSHAANDGTHVTYRDANGKEHGPIPHNEWSDYSAKNNL